VDDLVDGLVRLMETADAVTGPINIGNPAKFSIRELAEIVIEVTGSRSKIVSRPLPADDPRQRQPDIAKARHMLGWTPRTPLKEGLVRTIAYFEALLEDDDVRAMVGGKSAM
jgi:UDP-glucuronate decarboxylase